MIDPATEATKKEKLRQALIQYCTKDTMGMVQLVDWLFECADDLYMSNKK